MVLAVGKKGSYFGSINSMGRATMSEYFRGAAWQDRDNLQENGILMAIAQIRAVDMCDRNYFDHQDPDGIWPNQYVRQAGYNLPKNYYNDSNQIESIATGHADEIEALNALAASPSHMAHMRGKYFWEDHLFFGVGLYVENSCKMYVVITAPTQIEDEHNTDIYIPVISKGVRAHGRAD